MGSESTGAYVSSQIGTRLHQGEILSNVVERTASWISEDEGFGLEEFVHPFAVLVTQDCDLEQDWRSREDPDLDETKRRKGELRCVRLVAASEFDRSGGALGSSEIKRQVRMNKNERYQYLCAVAATSDASGAGVPALLLDFKYMFTYRTDQLLLAISRNKRFGGQG